MMEVVEPRVLFAAFVVTNTNDAGAGSLRQAILDANAAPGPGNGGHGVLIDGGSNNFVAENTIAFNAGDGVSIVNNGTTVASGNDVSLNSFFANTGLGIDLGNDGPTANDPLDADTGPN